MTELELALNGISESLGKLQAQVQMLTDCMTASTQTQLRQSIAISAIVKADKLLVKKLREEKGELRLGEKFNGDLMEADRDLEKALIVMRPGQSAWAGG